MNTKPNSYLKIAALLLITLLVDVVPDQIHSLKAQATAAEIEEAIASMTLREKVGELFFVNVPTQYRNNENSGFKELQQVIKSYKPAGIIMRNGHVYATAENINRLQAISSKPLLVGSTLEWGLQMRLSSGTRFPENMAIAATQKPRYVYQQGVAIAKEMKALGFHINFAPVLDVNNNPDNPIINVRSYGERPDMVGRYGVAFINGLQSEGIAATAKHFPGHGDTGQDSHILLPTVDVSYDRLKRVELAPFKQAIDAGVQMIMTAHIALPQLPQGDVPATLNPFVEQSILRDSLGFDGVIVTDALNMGGIVRGYWPGEAAVKAIQAGTDMLIFSPDFKLAYQSVLEAVQDGRISQERLHESLRRIQNLKQFVQVEQYQKPSFEQVNAVVEHPDHLVMADKMYRESITLVKDDNSLLPLDAGKLGQVTAIVLTDDNRYGYPGSTFLSEIRQRIDRTRVFRIGPDPSDQQLDEVDKAIEQSDATVIGTFVQFRNHKGSIGLPEKQATWLEKTFTTETNVTTVGFGNPYLLKYFPAAPSYSLTYSVADGAQRAAIEALFGEIAISGKLPVTLPSGYSFGHGLDKNIYHNEWVDDLHPERFEKAFGLINKAIADTAAPGMSVYIAKEGKVLAARGVGRFTYHDESPQVERRTIYDLASMTKVVATTPVAMEMYERKLLHLDKPVATYLPRFNRRVKKEITVRNLLTHTAGLQPFIKFWEVTDDPSDVMELLTEKPLNYSPGDSTVYSDLGIISTAKILEKIGRAPLDELAQEIVYKPLGMENTIFTPPAEIHDRIPPTEFDKALRNKLVHGEVHDENAAFFGGISGHAGLFSTVDDLGRYAQMLLSNGYLNGKKYFSQFTIEHFTKRQNITDGSTRALGWDTPSERRSTYGSYFSDQAYGHTGYTGTSMIIDPKYDIIVILLSNRVYDTRERRNLYKYRPQIHNAIMEELLTTEQQKAALAK